MSEDKILKGGFIKSSHGYPTKYKNLCASVNITTGAYVEISNVTNSLGQESGFLRAYNGSDKVIILAFGAAGKEQDSYLLFPGINPIEGVFSKQTRISLKALDAAATSGTIALDFFV